MVQTSTRQAPAPRLGLVRKAALAGLGLFFLGFALGGVANSATNLLWITPYADTITALGVVFALFGAIRAGSSMREILIVGIIFGVGTFYVGEPHAAHIASGIGFGLDHILHIFIGLGLWAVSTAIASLLSFYHTRKL